MLCGSVHLGTFVLGHSQAYRRGLESLVWGVQPASGQVVLVDPSTGNQLHCFPAPDALSAADTQIALSIAEGGTSLLYINSDIDPGKLYRLNPWTGAVLSTETTDGLGYGGFA